MADAAPRGAPRAPRRDDAALRTIGALRAINRGIALAGGVALLATVLFVLTEIALRAVGAHGLGGSDEIAGYVMAGVTSWGLAFALTERAHIRIDMAVRRLRPLARDVVDTTALVSIASVAVTVAVYGWAVVGKSLERGSRANTPLETPLAWPQGIWWAGWLWFAVCACFVAAVGLALLIRRRSAELNALASDAEADILAGGTEGRPA